MQKRLQNKPYLSEISTKPTALWFRAKRYGWGWVPVTWQGWGITIMFVFWLVSEIVFVNNHSHSVSDFLMQVVPTTYIMFVFFVIVCYATGEKPAWNWGKKKEDRFDVLDANGKMIGETATRTDVHERGLWHRAAHVYIVNQSGDVLLQRRSASNTFRPGRWYLSAGGHLCAGETSVQSAAREVQKDLHVSIPEKDFELAGTITKQNVLLYGSYINNEFDDIFVVCKDIDTAKLVKDDEATQFAWFPVEKFKEFIAGNDPSFVNYEGLPVLFKYLETHAHKK